eukprot:6791290-Pyramimonas_sp.AAC.1
MGSDWQPATSERQANQVWARHFASNEAAPAIPFSDLDWFEGQLNRLPDELMHEVPFHLSDVPTAASVERVYRLATCAGAGADGSQEPRHGQA